MALSYHQAINRIVIDGLLHLYFHVNASKGFVPVAKRNQIISKWLKERLEKPIFAAAKRDIKTMILIGKKPGTNLESKLLELNITNKSLLADVSSADHLYRLFNDLHAKHGVQSRAFKPDEPIEIGVIYMAESEL